MTVDPEDVGSNPSDNSFIDSVVAARFSRRSVMTGGLATAALGFFGGGALSAPAAAVTPSEVTAADGCTPSKLGFAAIRPSSEDLLWVPPGYEAYAIIPWGTPLSTRGPAFKKDASNTAAEQAEQTGMNHDGMHFFPIGTGAAANTRGLLALNHEYVDRVLLYTDGDSPMTQEKVDKALAAHGVSVVEVALQNGRWNRVDSRYNRRVTGTTPMDFSGPVAASHPLLQSKNAPMGTLNNCAHGVTPWGTYLTCEENFNGYFGTDDTSFTPSPLEARYGFRKDAGGKVPDGGYKWYTVDKRFDLAVNRGEANRFGWVVEIDPFAPQSRPAKRTALGRVKHESATATEAADGRVVVYTGDDENLEYVYKFVSARPWRTIRGEGKSPLDEGSLYVAKFSDNGTGEWLPLTTTNPKLSGFSDQADILIRTRMAADAAGATKLHRPEWVAVDPRNKDVFLTLTNGSDPKDAEGRFQPTGRVNSRPDNPYGSVIKWTEAGGDPGALTFRWQVFVFAGDPKHDPTVTLPDNDIFGSPDGVWVDRDGRVWIQTDVSNSTQLRSVYDRIGNNQMLVADPDTREIRRFLVGPRGCEITGITVTPDQTTMFINVQHPGESTTAVGSPTPANPRAVSNWPDYDSGGRPRSSTVVIRKSDGGKIGT